MKFIEDVRKIIVTSSDMGCDVMRLTGWSKAESLEEIRGTGVTELRTRILYLVNTNEVSRYDNKRAIFASKSLRIKKQISIWWRIKNAIATVGFVKTPDKDTVKKLK
jgi:hypothetical protein